MVEGCEVSGSCCGEGKSKVQRGGPTSFVFLTLAGEGRSRENPAAGNG